MGLHPVIRGKILIRCDGGAIPEIGMGHVYRCVRLGKHLAARGCSVSFLTRSEAPVAAMMRSEGFPARELKSEKAAELLDVLREEAPEIVVWDRLDTTVELARTVKAFGALLITLDDAGEGQALADITVNATIEGGDTPYRGIEYAVLDPVPPSPRENARPVRRVALSFGGYDHGDITSVALGALSRLNEGVELHAIVGPASRRTESLARLAAGRPGTFVHEAPKNYLEILASADIAVLAGGVTLLEALARGLPCLAVSQYAHQRRTISALEKAGALIDLGPCEALTSERLVSEFERLRSDAGLRERLSSTARHLVDGRGLKRVGDLAGVVDILSWDCEFFGVRTATLHPRRINEDIVRYAFKKCEEASVECLYYLCDCHDPRSVRLAEKYGFHFVDIRLTFFTDPRRRSGALVPAGFTLRPSREADIEFLRGIASTSYVHTRYYFDERFPRSVCERFYSDWVAKACRSEQEHVIVAQGPDGKALGYIACSMRNQTTGSISLVGVSSSSAGLGIGKALVQASLDWFAAQGAWTVEVVTQGRNYHAQRLYQSCGFKTLKTELWYHRWFDRK